MDGEAPTVVEPEDGPNPTILGLPLSRPTPPPAADDRVPRNLEGTELLAHVGIGLGGKPGFGSFAKSGHLSHGSSVLSSRSGRGPTWEITSAAAMEPSFAQCTNGYPRV
mgnify:CR=1 FL=1